MIAAMVLGRDALPPPATFDVGILMIAMLIHFTLSIICAIVLTLIIRNWSTGSAVAAGAMFGLLIYLINFYVLASALFPWFAMARVALGGFLHNLGKIGVVESILNKPYRLAPDEYEVMKTYPEVGARLLTDHPLVGIVGMSMIPIAAGQFAVRPRQSKPNCWH